MPSNVIYNITKLICDQEYGIISQCMKAEYIINCPRGYFDNFLQKVNGKFGGLNSILNPSMLQKIPINFDETMVLGVDVNHPGETEKVVSSIAAAVASTDSKLTRYACSIRVQKKERDEMIRQLDDMLKELLEEYKKVNKKYPKNLIVFRDGVSEGQFEKLIKIEIPRVQQIMNRNPNMKLTWIVVQKRHHTRFVLAEQNTSGRKPTYNVPSGTVVDQTIVEPNFNVFYLNSHFSPLVSHYCSFVFVFHKTIFKYPLGNIQANQIHYHS